MVNDAAVSAAPQGRPGRPLWLRAAVRLLVFAVIWWLLADGNLQSWLIGAPVVVLAAVASLALAERAGLRWSPLGIVRFVPFFLWESLRGGAAAAAIVFTRPGRVDPQLVRYRTRLPAGAPRALLAGIAGLLPGTLAADIRDDVLEVHVLDSSIPAIEEMARLERRIAAMAGLAGAAEGETWHG